MNDKTKSKDLIISQQKSYAQQINQIKFENRKTSDLIDPDDNEIKINNPNTKFQSNNIIAPNQMKIISDKVMPDKNNQDKPKKQLSYKTIALIIIILVTISCVCTFIIIRIINKKKNKEITNNKIIAIYKGEHEKKIKIINSKLYGNQINGYKIYQGENNLRYLDEDILEDGKLYSFGNDLIIVQLNFNSSLSSLGHMFEGCENLINIDLSNIESDSIKNMSHTFANCNNLQKVNLKYLNTFRVSSMDSLFEGCKNLVDIQGLENLNTDSLKNISKMFVNCENLIIVNLSSFNLDKIKYKDNIFDKNPSLRYIDVSNSKNIDNIITTIFNINYFNNKKNHNLIIKVKDISSNSFSWLNYKKNDEDIFISCDIGEYEKCKSCNNYKETRFNCKTCNEGYYLPSGNIYSKTRCRKCDDYCIQCEGKYDISYCLKCKDGFHLNRYNRCIGQNEELLVDEENEEKKEIIEEELIDDEEKELEIVEKEIIEENYEKEEISVDENIEERLENEKELKVEENEMLEIEKENIEEEKEIFENEEEIILEEKEIYENEIIEEENEKENFENKEELIDDIEEEDEKIKEEENRDKEEKLGNEEEKEEENNDYIEEENELNEMEEENKVEEEKRKEKEKDIKNE